jgi:hypothetical protein
MTPGRMTYDLRRLRLHGLIERIPGTYRYEVTDFGLRVALFFTRAHARLLRPGLGQVLGPGPPRPLGLRRAFDRLEAAMDHLAQQARRLLDPHVPGSKVSQTRPGKLDSRATTSGLRDI